MAEAFSQNGQLPSAGHRIDVGVGNASSLVCMARWRDGELKTDSAFFAWLLCQLNDEVLYPLFELHCHPSHKGLHAKLPCKTEFNYEGRQLPGAPELALSSADGLDPRNEADRQKLINRFCQACGITMGLSGGLWN